MLQDRSVLIGQKLVENAKIQKFKCDILSNFQTMCSSAKLKTHIFSRLVDFLAKLELNNKKTIGTIAFVVNNLGPREEADE